MKTCSEMFGILNFRQILNLNFSIFSVFIWFYTCAMLKFCSIIFFAVLIEFGRGKVFSKCELAQVLIEGQNETLSDTRKLMCIAQLSSTYNTQYLTRSSYGIFNISSDQSEICNISLSSLIDDDIKDDLICAKKFIESNNRTCDKISFDNCDFFNATLEQEETTKKPVETTTSTSTPGAPADTVNLVNIDDRVSTTSEPKLDSSTPGTIKPTKPDSREDKSKKESTTDGLPDGSKRLFLQKNYVIQHPKPNVNLEIFLFEWFNKSL